RNEDEELLGKTIAGRDIVRNQGPIGESILPAPHIGYARVASHPIHQGASTSGFTVKDFYTLRDFPSDMRYSGVGNSIDHTEVDGRDYSTSPLFSNLLIYRHQENLVHRTQGYRFIQTDIHGKPRSMRTMGGVYTPYEDSWMTSSFVEYDYFHPGDSIPLLDYPGDTIRHGWPG